MSESPPSEASSGPLQARDEFTSLLGPFYGIWASIDLTTDFAIGKFLNLTPFETYLVTSGQMFGKKARLLAELVKRSSYPKKAELTGAVNLIRGKAKRDIFAHGHMWSNENVVTFVERSGGGDSGLSNTPSRC